MSSSAAARDAAAKKKHVRFASMEDDEPEEDTLFDQRTDSREPRSALKAAQRSRRKPGGDERARGVGGRGGPGACGRWLVTLALCGSFLGLGMSISVLGPTFKDLAENVNRSISNISYIFVGRSGGYIGGSLIGGILFEWMNPHLLLGLSVLLTAFGMFAIPFCKQAALLTCFMASVGISMGALDTGGNVLILNTWGAHSGSHMQALHFSFAAGAFASPIIAKLLFGSESGGTTNATSQNATSEVTAAPPIMVDSMWSYIVIGSFLLLNCCFFFALYARGGGAQEKPRPASERPPVARHHSALVVMLFFFFFAYVGAEVAYGSFIFTYAKDYAHLSPPQAAGLNSLFWGAFAATRGLAIFFAACLPPGAMIVLCLVGSTASSLLLSALSRSTAALWVCSGLYGASMATTFPSGVSWLEQYTPVTGRTAATFVVGAGLGEMVLPALVGFLLGRFPGQPLLMYLSLLTSTFTTLLFPLMYKLASAPGGQRLRPRSPAEDGEFRQALLDSGGHEEEEEDEAEQWNEADFEVIEMDEASGVTDSPNKTPPPPGAAGPPAAPSSQTPEAPGPVSDPGLVVKDSLKRQKKD